MRMPWRRHDERLDARLAEAITAASAAKAAARRAEAVAELVLAELSQMNEEPPGLRFRALRLWATCLIILVASAGIIVYGAQVFTSPNKSPGSAGWLALAVHDVPKNALDENGALEYGITASYTDFDLVAYQIYLPKGVAGKSFTLFLFKDAQISNVFEGVDADLSDSTHDQNCYKDDPEVRRWLGGRADSPCEVIRGVIPDQFVDASCSLRDFDDSSKYVVLDVEGELKPSMASLGWAHQMVTFPSLAPTAQFELRGNQIMRDLNFHDLTAYNISSCRSVEVPDDYVLTYITDEQNSRIAGPVVSWMNAQSSGTLIFKGRNADAKGNITVAFGGALAGLAVGLVPVAVEALRDVTMARRRRQRLVKARQ
jgi:hypothetical protein